MQPSSEVPFPVRLNVWTWKILRFPLTRLVLGVVLVVVAQEVGKIVVAAPLGVFLHLMGIGPIGDNPFVRLLLEIAGALGVLLAYFAFVRVVEKRPVYELSLSQAAQQFGAGILVALVLVGITLVVLWLAGVYSIVGTNVWTVSLVVLANALSAAVLEETVFRGLLFRITEEGLGTWLTLAVTALIFGLLHLFSANTSVAAAVSIILTGGILLGAAYILTRSLWLPIGIHVGYNFLTGLSAPAVGVAATPLFQGRLAGPVFLSGGGNLDASGVLIAVSLLISVFLLLWARHKGRIVRPTWWHNEALRFGNDRSLSKRGANSGSEE